MSDHEQLHAQREREAADLEHDGEHLEHSIEEARAARDRAADDELIPAPASEEPDESGPETDYPTKR